MLAKMMFLGMASVAILFGADLKAHRAAKQALFNSIRLQVWQDRVKVINGSPHLVEVVYEAWTIGADGTRESSRRTQVMDVCESDTDSNFVGAVDEARVVSVDVLQ